MLKKFEQFEFDEEETAPLLGVDMKDEVERMLIDIFRKIGIDVPENFENIVQYCYEDVMEVAGDDWHDGDVSIAFRRWIEEQ